MSRLLTAIALIAVAIYLIFFAPNLPFFTAAGIFGWLCFREYASLVEAHGILRPNSIGIAGGFAILIWPQFALPEVSIATLCAFIWSLSTQDLRQILPSVAGLMLGIVYAFVPWRFAVDLRLMNVHVLFFALALNWVGDSAAYYIGRSMGKHKLAPSVSPGKSREGAVASVIASVIFGVAYLNFFVPYIPSWKIAVIATFANVAGQLGDLAESALKRGAGVKDSGNFLPGHGGILDRMDSSLFSLPLVYVLLRFLT
jgi:phosphatidate cytidylyltransferase